MAYLVFVCKFVGVGIAMSRTLSKELRGGEGRVPYRIMLVPADARSIVSH